MPDKDEEETSEKSNSKEEKEKKTQPPESSKEEEKEEKKEGEEEKEGEEGEEEGEKKIEEKEPPKRFPKKEEEEEEQTPAEKRAAYWKRQWEKIKKEKEEGNFGEEEKEIESEEEKPVTKKEFREALEKKSKEDMSERFVDEFLRENPDFVKYEKRIRKYARDPDYANVPIGFIASGIVGERLDEEANERAKSKIKADEEAEKTKIGGSTKRGFPTGKKIWDMTGPEFEAHQAEVLQKGRD